MRSLQRLMAWRLGNSDRNLRRSGSWGVVAWAVFDGAQRRGVWWAHRPAAVAEARWGSAEEGQVIRSRLFWKARLRVSQRGWSWDHFE